MNYRSKVTPSYPRAPVVKRLRSDQELTDLAWRPQRVYGSVLEACPTQYPDWWEGPPRHQAGTVWVLSLVCLGLVGLIVLF
jgi:hypothetical protein